MLFLNSAKKKNKNLILYGKQLSPVPGDESQMAKGNYGNFKHFSGGCFKNRTVLRKRVITSNALHVSTVVRIQIIRFLLYFIKVIIQSRLQIKEKKIDHS